MTEWGKLSWKPPIDFITDEVPPKWGHSERDIPDSSSNPPMNSAYQEEAAKSEERNFYK